MTNHTSIALAISAVVALSVAHPASAAWPDAARAKAAAAAARWSADVPAPARLGAEPPGPCRRVDAAKAACPIGIAIAILARDRVSRRPWRCSATLLVSRTGERLTARRTATRCVPFPRPALPDGAASLGSAIALGANGDLSCLPANDLRTTCVMSYLAPTGGHCVRAASVPLARPARSVALGGPICR